MLQTLIILKFIVHIPLAKHWLRICNRIILKTYFIVCCMFWGRTMHYLHLAELNNVKYTLAYTQLIAYVFELRPQGPRYSCFELLFTFII